MVKLPDQRITIIGGHYGTGKTEFAINLAIAMARDGRRTALVDLDIVNPYFRSVERQKELEKKGIRVLATSRGGKADTPALPAEILSVFADPDLWTIIDLGGDPIGARVLGYYKPQLDACPHDFWFLINRNRPENATLEKATAYLRETEKSARQEVTGIVNSTHLGSETDLDGLLKGDAFAARVAGALDLPLIYTVAERKFEEPLRGILEGSFFPIDLYMLKPWDLGKQEGGIFEWLET